MAARRTDCRDRPSLSLEHRLAPQQMGKPLDAQSDQELERALAEGSLDERKEAIAKEILSRRWQAKSEAIKTNYGWFGGEEVSPSVGALDDVQEIEKDDHDNRYAEQP